MKNKIDPKIKKAKKILKDTGNFGAALESIKHVGDVTNGRLSKDPKKAPNAHTLCELVVEKIIGSEEFWEKMRITLKLACKQAIEKY